MRRFRWLSLILIIGIGRSTSFTQNAPQSDFKKLTLEELMDVNVTSEDIRRTGVTTIPEALCLVPGLEFARFNAGSWAISARGFNSTAANKLLVLIDM
jgi:iron complex outermembrane receptor protein